MEITLHEEGDKLLVELDGRLDTLTSAQLAEALEGKEPKELIIDLAKLEYISSAGLRVFLAARKSADQRGGTMVVKNLNAVVREVFRITGFDRNIHIE